MYKFEFCTPEAAGIPSRELIRLLDELEKVEFIHYFSILRHGRVCMEAVRKPFDPDTPHQLFSVSKSFVSAAVGIAAGEGRLGLEDRLIDFFPEYAKTAHPLMARTRLCDLLSMQSGFAECPAGKMLESGEEWVKYYLSLVPDREPGSFFHYVSAATFMLAAVLKRVTGMNVREYLIPRLFEPLGIVPGVWEGTPQGVNYGGWGLYLKPRDLMKFGKLLLDGGKYAGNQLIPADYLAEAVKAHADNSMNDRPDWKLGYCWQFWRSTHGYRCDGASGQYAVVVPEHDLLVTTLSAVTDMQKILTLLWEILIPALAERPLAEDAAACGELRAKLAALAVPVAVGDGTPARPVRKVFEFSPNASGIVNCAVEVGEEECALTFTRTDGKVEQLRAGFGSFRFGAFQLTDREPHPTASAAAWRDGKLVIEAFILNGIYRSIYTVDFTDGATEPIRRQDVCTCFRRKWVPLTVR